MIMRLPVILTIVVAVAFYGLLLLGAFAGRLLATPIIGHIPLSFILGWGFIIGIVLVTALYAAHANRAEDAP